MKTKLTLLCAGVLMCAFCAACDDKEKYDGIRPVPASAEVKAFFNENLNLVAGAIFYDYNEFETQKFIDSCVMINSMDEFQQIDFRDETPPQLPVIDFDSHTLVIGQWISGSYWVCLVSQSLVVKQNVATMKLVVDAEDGLHEQIYQPTPHFIWGLYPKITAKYIKTNVTHKN